MMNLDNLENVNAIELNDDALDEVSGGKNGSAGYIKTTGSVNVRKGPGLDYDSMGTVPSGTKLTYTGSSRKDERGVTWYHVVSKSGKKGWVSSKYAKRI